VAVGALNEAHPIADVAREAYAMGWALSGGPMTDRVRAGSIAAVQLAVEHADDPTILEVTLKLGSLEGVWATVYQRRETLIADRTRAITAAWLGCARSLDTDRLITNFRASVYTTETADPHRTFRREQANRAGLAYMSGIHYTAGYDTLRDHIADALRAATAEGRASGQAIATIHPVRESAADSLDIEFQQAYDQLANLQDWPGMSDRWIQRIIQGSANDVGQLLATMSADGAAYDDMVSAVMDLISSGDVGAVSAFIDQAMSAALNQGAVDLYASEGQTQYEVLTAGDSRVCKYCQQAEADSPYPVTTPSPVSLHPGCRCATAPVANTYSPGGT
jgi:hypothetical protein